MRLNRWVPSPGCLVDWDIDEIMSRPSCDVDNYLTEVCTQCGATCYDGWGWILNGKHVDTGDDEHYHEDFAREATLAESWGSSLARKRMDGHYEDVLESIRTRGFLRPLTAWPNDSEGQLQFGDGHHRLAAAIDLGMTTVPVKVYDGFKIANDSGDWYSSEPIPSEQEAYR